MSGPKITMTHDKLNGGFPVEISDVFIGNNKDFSDGFYMNVDDNRFLVRIVEFKTGQGITITLDAGKFIQILKEAVKIK